MRGIFSLLKSNAFLPLSLKPQKVWLKGESLENLQALLESLKIN